MQNEDLLKDPTVSLKYYKQKLKSKYQLRTKVKGHLPGLFQGQHSAASHCRNHPRETQTPRINYEEIKGIPELF